MNIEKMKRGLKMIAAARGHKLGPWIETEIEKSDCWEFWCECSACRQVLICRPTMPTIEMITGNPSILESDCY